MTAPTLCIIQARLHSTRLTYKMLLTLGDETLIARAWRMACATFDPSCVVVAIPAGDAATPLGEELRRIGATIFPWMGQERDVLGRFWACAHHYRWHPATVIFRWTPDDPFKVANDCRAVAAGWRLPVEQGGEAFTLAMLDEAHEREIVVDSGGKVNQNREHITYALFPTQPPIVTDGQCWTVDTVEDLKRAQVRVLTEDSITRKLMNR